MTEARRIRAGNYAVKRRHAFKCAECGADDRILAVTVRAEPEGSAGRYSTRCERCLDRRAHEVHPRQWDEAERLQAELAKAKP